MSSVPSPNQVLLSAAGSGKTTLLVRQALARSHRRIAILTYTLENLEEIRRAFERHVGAVPSHVTLYSWYSFLLRECIRPYQAALCAQPRVESIFFEPSDGLVGTQSVLGGTKCLKDRRQLFVVPGGKHVECFLHKTTIPF